MLSQGAKQIKLSLGIPPVDHNGDKLEPDVCCIDFLSPKAKEFISELEENNTDEAKKHRGEILHEFRTLCKYSDIYVTEIEEWPRLSEISGEDRLFVEAMDDYTKWGITQDTDTPMSAYTMGKMFAAFLDMYEDQSEGQNNFQKKCSAVLSNDPEKAGGLIGIRAIANGHTD